MVAAYLPGDAVGNASRRIQAALRQWGYASDIYTGHPAGGVPGEAYPYHDYPVEHLDRDGLVVHYSVGSPAMEHALRARVKRAMIYHNITPAEFFEGYSAHMVAWLDRGREELRAMRSQFAIAVGVSAYNAQELRDAGYADVRVLPIVASFEDLAVAPSRRVLAAMRGPERRVIFVGRISPNKKQDDLITAFAHYQRINPRSRLVLIGGFEPEEPYYRQVRQWATDVGAKSVEFTGRVMQAELNAYYQSANLFVSMSEHEGFGIPLLEAMYFGVPVLAYKAAAVSETMGGAGVLFTEKRYPEIAEMMDVLVEDQELRARIIERQRKRVEDFAPEQIMRQFAEVIAEFEAA